jgi:hypothetical protein
VILPIPLSVEPGDGDGGQLPERTTLAVWVWLALALATFAVERLVVLDHELHVNLLPDPCFAVVTFVMASWSLYADPALFAPWQPWTSTLVGNGWTFLLADLAVMLVIGRAAERLGGSLALATALFAAAALAGLAFCVSAQAGVFTGSAPLALGAIGLVWAMLPSGRVRVGFAWWAVVAVGVRPLSAVRLHTVALAYLALHVLLAPEHLHLETLLADAAALFAGFLAGLAVRVRRTA